MALFMKFHDDLLIFFSLPPELWQGSSSAGLIECEPVDGSGSGVRGSEWGGVCGDEGGTEELSVYPVGSRTRSTRPCLTQDPTAACRGEDTAHEMAKPGNWRTVLCHLLTCSFLCEKCSILVRQFSFLFVLPTICLFLGFFYSLRF